MQISTVGFAYRGAQFALTISCNTQALNFSFPYSVSRLSTALLPPPPEAASQVGLLMKVRGAHYLPSCRGARGGEARLGATAR